MIEQTEIEQKLKDVSDSCNGPDMGAWLLLIRVYDRMQRHSTAHMHMEPYELTPAQYDVLAQLSSAPGINQQALAERLLVTKGNVCTLLERMENHGYVVRREDPEDRRSKLLYLTERGREVALKAIPAYAEFIREHMAALTEQEHRTLEALLRKLDRYLDDH